MPVPFQAARESADWLAERTGHAAYDAVVVLGSGWAPAVDGWGEPLARVSMADVPHFTPPVAEGHRGEVLAYDLDGTSVLVLSGRTHLYEGLGPRPVVHGVRTAASLGARLALLTNANGSLRPEWEVGQPVLIADHLNLTGISPIEGARSIDPSRRLVPRLLRTSLTDAWSPRLRALARALEPELVEGVYAHLVGPHYNTAAEAEWLRRLGADLVGMSTVPEAIAARECGLEVVGLSTVTAVEGDSATTDPSEVVAAAEGTAGRMGPTLAALLRRGCHHE